MGKNKGKKHKEKWRPSPPKKKEEKVIEEQPLPEDIPTPKIVETFLKPWHFQLVRRIMTITTIFGFWLYFVSRFSVAYGLWSADFCIYMAGYIVLFVGLFLEYRRVVMTARFVLCSVMISLMISQTEVSDLEDLIRKDNVMNIAYLGFHIYMHNMIVDYLMVIRGMPLSLPQHIEYI